jgi:hypothetical protein
LTSPTGRISRPSTTQRGKRLDQAIADAVRFNRYYVVAAHYREASEAIRTGGLQIIGDATDAQRKLIAALQIKPEAQDCWFIFQEKNGVPNLLARQFIFFDVPDAIEISWDTGPSEEAQARGHAATLRPTQIYQLAMAEIETRAQAIRALRRGLSPRPAVGTDRADGHDQRHRFLTLLLGGPAMTDTRTESREIAHHRPGSAPAQSEDGQAQERLSPRRSRWSARQCSIPRSMPRRPRLWPS